MIQDEADPKYILQEDFNAGVAALPDFGLRYDILIFESHLPGAIQFVDRHPKQTFILDHVASPGSGRAFSRHGIAICGSSRNARMCTVSFRAW